LYIVAAVALFIALLLQLSTTSHKALAPRQPSHPRSKLPLSPFGDSVYRAEAYYEQLEPGTRCKPRNPFALPITDAITNMALEEEAKRIAAQFEYTSEDVNKGVDEFIAEMEEGLAKQGAMMSQIPTCVWLSLTGSSR
jgi:hypothetical protein